MMSSTAHTTAPKFHNEYSETTQTTTQARQPISSTGLTSNQPLMSTTNTHPIQPVQPVATATTTTTAPVYQEETVTTTTHESRPLHTGPTTIPAHPVLTPQVPEGTTILNYPGAAAAGPAVSQPTQLPVGPTSGVQQGTTHDRYMRSTNTYLPAVGKNGAVGNYITNEPFRGPEGGVQPVLYPTQSVTGSTPIVQQGTYPTAGTLTGMTGTGTGSANSKYHDYAYGDTAIGMYGDRPGNTAVVNNFPENRAAFDNHNYGSTGVTGTKHPTAHSHVHNHPTHQHNHSTASPAIQSTSSTVTTETSYPTATNIGANTSNVYPTTANTSNLSTMYDKNQVAPEPSYERTDITGI